MGCLFALLKGEGDDMGNKRRETTRGYAKEKLRQSSNRLTEASRLLGEVHLIYADAAPLYGKGFEQIIKMITMVEAMVVDLRDRL